MYHYMRGLRGSVTPKKKNSIGTIGQKMVLILLLSGLSILPTTTQGQGNKGEEYKKLEAKELLTLLSRNNQDLEYIQLLEEIYVNIDDPNVGAGLKTMLYEKKELIKNLISNKECKNFLQALHDEEKNSPKVYLSQLDELLPYDFNYIHEMSQLYNRVQRLIYKDNGIDEAVISNNFDKEFINTIISHVDHFVLLHFLKLDFLSSKKLENIIQRQLNLIVEDMSKKEDTIIKKEDQAILGLAISRESPLIQGEVYQKAIIPFSSTENSQCYISQTPAGAGTYLCSLQDNFLTYSIKNNRFPGLEQHYFAHIDMNMQEEDLVHHFGKIIEKAIRSSKQKEEIIILINGFSHTNEHKNCTSDFFFSSQHQGFENENDFGLVPGNSRVLKKIAKQCAIISSSTIRYKGSSLSCKTNDGTKVTIYTSKTPVDTDGTNNVFSPNNTKKIGAIEILTASMEKTNPTIIIATGQTEINFSHVTGNNNYQSEIRIEGLGPKIPSKYFHSGLKNLYYNEIPDYFSNQGDNPNIYRLLKNDQ